MFFKTSSSNQSNLFSSTNTFLSGSSLKTYEASKSWHNLFRERVTLQIDEEIFRPLFCQIDGAPNASVRVLVGMMVLKESRGWSDAQLFEECRFNLLVRSALCLPNIDDPVPAESTYYLFRKRIVDWEKAGNENLIEKVFSQVTRSQIIEFKINGKHIRMDSKLLGSNIAWYSRYELIHETLRKAYPHIQSEMPNLNLKKLDIKLLEEIFSESGNKVSYRSNQTEIASKIAALGELIYKIIRRMRTHPSEEVQTLCRVFKEQYLKKDGAVQVRPKEQVTAQSVQSPHDTECHYRNKDGNQVKGYAINVTETCSHENPLNLVTNVQVNVASTADCDFLQPSIEACEQVVLQKTETINSDGAYHSVENQEYCKEKGIDLIVGAIQGKPPRYDLTLDKNNELIVKDLQTNTIVTAQEIKSRKNGEITKWRIKNEKGQNRYFTQKEIDTCLLRKQIGERTRQELNVRNNVEASIFQLGYHYPHDKSRYRGLSKHKIWANVRCLWVNFVRILKFIARNTSNWVKKTKKGMLLTDLLSKIAEILFVILSVENFSLNLPQKRLKLKIEKRYFL